MVGDPLDTRALLHAHQRDLDLGGGDHGDLQVAPLVQDREVALEVGAGVEAGAHLLDEVGLAVDAHELRRDVVDGELVWLAGDLLVQAVVGEGTGRVDAVDRLGHVAHEAVLEIGAGGGQAVEPGTLLVQPFRELQGEVLRDGLAHEVVACRVEDLTAVDGDVVVHAG